jgi:hypothetical protein
VSDATGTVVTAKTKTKWNTQSTSYDETLTLDLSLPPAAPVMVRSHHVPAPCTRQPRSWPHARDTCAHVGQCVLVCSHTDLCPCHQSRTFSSCFPSAHTHVLPPPPTHTAVHPGARAGHGQRHSLVRRQGWHCLFLRHARQGRRRYSAAHHSGHCLTEVDVQGPSVNRTQHRGGQLPCSCCSP